MKTKILSLLLMLVAAAPSYATTKPATVKGSVPRYQGSGYMILFKVDRSSADTIKDIKADGTFKYEVAGVDADTPYGLYLEYLGDDAGMISLLLSPGKTTEVSITGSRQKDELLGKEFYMLKGSFRGANAKESEFLNISQLPEINYKNGDGTPISFNNFLQQIEEKRQSLRQALKGCKPSFVEEHTGEIDDLWKGNEFVYYRWLKINGDDATKDADFMQFVKSIDMETCPLELAVDNADFQLAKDTTLYAGKPLRARFFLYINDHIRDRARVAQIADNAMEMSLSVGDNEDLPEVFAAYELCSKTGEVHDACAEKVKSLSALTKGVRDSDFMLKDVDGNDVHFLDIIGHGKATYIDFWATWCGPCVMEIPYVEKKVEKYKDNPNIRFVSISLDNNIKKWHDKLDRDKPAWKQYVIPDNFNSAFAKQYNVTAIPRFMFFDKDGGIITINAPHPSDDEAFEQLVSDYVK